LDGYSEEAVIDRRKEIINKRCKKDNLKKEKHVKPMN